MVGLSWPCGKRPVALAWRSVQLPSRAPSALELQPYTPPSEKEKNLRAQPRGAASNLL